MSGDKVHIRHCMLFLYKLGKTPAEAKKMIDEAYGDGSVGNSTCREWFAKFKIGKYELDDKPRSGRPQELGGNNLQIPLDNDPIKSTLELAEKLDVDH